MLKVAVKLFTLSLPLLLSIQAKSSEFNTIQLQTRLDVLSIQLQDFSINSASLREDIQYGTHKPIMDNSNTLTERVQERSNSVQAATNEFEKYLDNFQINTKNSSSHACKSFESTVHSIADGFKGAVWQNSKVDLDGPSFARRAMCLLFKDVGERPASTCEQLKSPSYAKHLISKVRMLLFMRQLDVVRSYYLLGLDSRSGEMWSTSGDDLQYSYEACHPENPREVLAKLDELRTQMRETSEAVVGVRGLSNLKSDLQGLRLIKESYKFRKGYRKVFGFAATLVTLEIASIAAASKFKSAMHGFSFMKNKWIGGAAGFGVEMGASVAAFTAADMIANSSEIINKIMNDKDEFEEEIRYFSGDDNLYQQNLDYLDVLLQNEINYKEKVLNLRKQFLESRESISICEKTSEIRSEMSALLRECPNCYLNNSDVANSSCD